MGQNKNVQQLLTQNTHPQNLLYPESSENSQMY